MSLDPDELKRAMKPLIDKHGDALMEIVSYRNTVHQLAIRESVEIAAMLDITTLRLISCALPRMGKTAEQYAVAYAEFLKTHETLSIIAGLED